MKSKNISSSPDVNNTPNNYENVISNLDKGVSFLDFSDVYLTKEQLNDLTKRIANNAFIGHIIWGALPNGTEDLIEQIENKLIENNKLYKSHPTDFVHGLLSSHRYETSKSGDKVKFTADSKGIPHINTKYNQYLEDWRIEKVFQPENTDDYYSVLYVNNKTHHAVLAHRGTDIPNSLKGKNASLKADLIEILNHNIGVQQAASYVSTKEALEITQQLGYNFSTAGHSLGAWLAELSVYFCHMDFDYYKVRAVTFDSPGSEDQMKILKSNVYNAETKISKNQFDIVTYLSAPNMVNVCNKHVGKVYRLAPEIKYPEALKKELPVMLPKFVKNIIAGNKYYLDSLLSVSGHSLSPMLDVFDPETGKPYPDKYAVVLDWPHIKHVTTTQPSLGVCKFALDKTPFIGSLPDFLKNVTVNAINQLFPKSVATLNSVSTVIASFLSGNTAISQLCETFRHFDLNTHGKGYVLKELQLLDQFALSYKGKYKTQTVDLSKDRSFTKPEGSIDWYLSQIAKTNAGILEKSLDEVSYKQLSIIKNGFKTQFINGKRHVALIDSVTKPHNITTLEQFKEYLLRLIEVNPIIKELLERSIKYEPMHNNSNIISNDLPARIINFIGREEVLSKIHAMLSTNQIVVINAFAGTGKSSAALEYGYLQSKAGKIVRWFNADSVDKIKENYEQLASDLGIDITHIDKEQQQKMLIYSVNNALAKLGKPMLLIFDDLQNYHNAREYLTNLPHHLVKVVITTRDNNLTGNLKHYIMLEPFSSEDAASYIRANLSGRVNDKTTADLIKLLGNQDGEVLPYRLSEAVEFLQENKLMWSLSRYIEYMKQYQNYRVETMLLIESLKDAPIALQILQYAAFLDPDSMSIAIFKELLQMDEEQLQAPIARLERLSLVSLNIDRNENPYLRMHKLAQDEIIRYINSGQSQGQYQLLTSTEIQQHLIMSLNNLMPEVIRVPSYDWKIAPFYYFHIQKILNSSKEVTSSEKGELYAKLGKYNTYISFNRQQALFNYQEALKIYKEVYKDQSNHPKIADSLNNIGLAYANLGQAAESLDYYKQALEMRQELYKGKHPKSADSLNNVGTAYQNLGQPQESLKYLKQALKMYQELYKGNHPEIAQSLNNVGIAYETLRQVEKGLDYQKQALKMYQELYKGNHPEIAQSLNNVGIAYETLRQVEKGSKYKQQALAMRQELYKGNHPDIASSLNDVGVAYYNLGQPEEGLNYYEQALAMKQELYKGNHLDIANSLSNAGFAYEKLGDKLKALELHKQCYFMRCKLLGQNHSVTSATKNKITALDPNFSGVNETRTTILERGIVNKEIIAVKQKIQENVLNKIHEVAGRGNWSSRAIISTPSFLGDWGVKGYLSEQYLKKILGELGNDANVKTAQMLCFEAICLGIMNSKEKNFNCIIEFAKAYPELLNEIIAEHPEYMVDGSIVKLCVSNPNTLTILLGQNFSGQGNIDYELADPWMEYTKEGMDELLKLRLEAAGQRDVKTIMPNYIWDGTEDNAQIITNEISSNLGERSLVVLNLFGKHWVGLAIEKSAETIDIHYMDSEQETIPTALKEQLIKKISGNYPQHNIQFTESTLELQQYNNCGPELIENLVFHVLDIERTTSQEDAVAIHSALWENSLIIMEC